MIYRIQLLRKFDWKIKPILNIYVKIGCYGQQNLVKDCWFDSCPSDTPNSKHKPLKVIAVTRHAHGKLSVVVKVAQEKWITSVLRGLWNKVLSIDWWMFISCLLWLLSGLVESSNSYVSQIHSSFPCIKQLLSQRKKKQAWQRVMQPCPTFCSTSSAGWNKSSTLP